MKIPPPVIVFVRPQAAGNLGALARVMSNFGCTDFRFTEHLPDRGTNPRGFSTMDWAMARKGQQILEAAQEFASLDAALHDVQIAIGSSGRDREFEGGYARPHVTPDEAFTTVENWQKQSQEKDFKWAFVLGPEDDGLNERECSLCQKLVRIPTVDQAPSMNIAMAAGCFLYHWNLRNLALEAAPGAASTDPGPFPRSYGREANEHGRTEWSTAGQKEQFLDYVMNTLARTKFLKYPDVEAVRARIRRWVQVAPIPLGELLFAFEIAYHLRAWGSGEFEARDFLVKK